MKMDKTYRFRNHFCKVIEDNYLGLLFFAGSIVSLVVDVIIGGKITIDAIISILICITVIVVAVISIISWRKTSVYIDGTVVVYEKNTLNKQTLTINIKDVSNVNVSRNIFEAITGTRKVKLDINSTAATETEITMCLKKNEAILFESLVAGVDDTNAESGVSGVTHNKEKDKGAGIKEVLAHSFFSLKLVSMLAFSILVGMGAVFSGAAEEKIVSIIDIGRGVGFMTIIISVVAGVVAFVKQFLAYYGFIALREEDAIIISYGIFNKHNFRMPIDKISAVSITTSLIGRIFDRSHIQIKCIGVGDEETEKSIITLSLSKEILHKELLRLIPEFMPEEMNDSIKISRKEMNKEPSKVKALYAIYGLMVTVFIEISGVIAASLIDKKFIIVMVTLALLLISYIVAFIIGKYYTSGYLFCDNHIVLCNGVLSRNTTIVRYNSIENIVLSEGPLLRRFYLSYGHISIKASLIGETINICHIGKDTKEEFLDRYLSKCRGSKII